MRYVQVRVPDEQREAMLDVLRDHGFGYTVTEAAAEQSDSTVISFVTPADAVEHVLDDLAEAGLDRTEFTVSLATEFAQFEDVDEVQNHWAKSPNQIAPATLRSKAKDLRLNTRSYLWMMFLSTVVATAGLLMSSPAVVVGSMVLAPIVSPMLTASVGAVRDDRGMVLDSVQMQGVGLAVGVVGAFLFGLLVKHFFAVPQALDVATMELVSIRFSPGMLSVAVGLAAGAAGAFGLATKGQVSIVGVMIAAALIPTAGAAGIGFAWGEPIVGIGAIVLLVLTIVAVNVGGYAMLRYLGYQPDEVDEGFFEVTTLRETLVLAGTIAVVLAVVLGVGFGSYQQFAFERSTNGAVTGVLEDGTYDGINVTEISTEYVGAGPFSDPATVTVTLSRTTDESYPDLPNEFDRAVTERTGENVTVQVEYQDYERSNVTRLESGDVGAIDRTGATAAAF